MGAFMGLLVGCLVMTGVMLLWNYLISRFLIFRKKHTARRQEG